MVWIPDPFSAGTLDPTPLNSFISPSHSRTTPERGRLSAGHCAQLLRTGHVMAQPFRCKAGVFAPD